MEVEQPIGAGAYVVVRATMRAKSKADGAALCMPIAEVFADLREGSPSVAAS